MNRLGFLKTTVLGAVAVAMGKRLVAPVAPTPPLHELGHASVQPMYEQDGTHMYDTVVNIGTWQAPLFLRVRRFTNVSYLCRSFDDVTYRNVTRGSHGMIKNLLYPFLYGKPLPASWKGDYLNVKVGA